MRFNQATLYSFFSLKVGIKNPQLLELMVEEAIVRRLKKKERILAFDTDDEIIYLLYSGIVVCFGNMEDTEILVSIENKPGRPLLNLGGMVRKGSHAGILTVSKTILIGIPVSVMRGNMNRFPEISDHILLFLNEKIHSEHEYRKIFSLSAEEKIRWFRETYQGLDGIIPKKVISRYLGINPSVYGRIIKKIDTQADG